MLLAGTAAGCGGGEEKTPAPAVTGTAPAKTQPAATATLPAGEASFALLDYCTYLDESGDLMIVGIIENTGDAASCPDYEALQLVDAGGTVIARPYCTTLELIAPGQKSPLVAEIYEYQGEAVVRALHEFPVLDGEIHLAVEARILLDHHVLDGDEVLEALAEDLDGVLYPSDLFSIEGMISGHVDRSEERFLLHDGDYGGCTAVYYHDRSILKLFADGT